MSTAFGLPILQAPQDERLLLAVPILGHGTAQEVRYGAARLGEEVQLVLVRQPRGELRGTGRGGNEGSLASELSPCSEVRGQGSVQLQERACRLRARGRPWCIPDVGLPPGGLRGAPRFPWADQDTSRCVLNNLAPGVGGLQPDPTFRSHVVLHEIAQAPREVTGQVVVIGPDEEGEGCKTALGLEPHQDEQQVAKDWDRAETDLGSTDLGSSDLGETVQEEEEEVKEKKE